VVAAAWAGRIEPRPPGWRRLAPGAANGWLCGAAATLREGLAPAGLAKAAPTPPLNATCRPACALAGSLRRAAPVRRVGVFFLGGTVLLNGCSGCSTRRSGLDGLGGDAAARSIWRPCSGITIGRPATGPLRTLAGAGPAPPDNPGDPMASARGGGVARRGQPSETSTPWIRGALGLRLSRGLLRHRQSRCRSCWSLASVGPRRRKHKQATGSPAAKSCGFRRPWTIPGAGRPGVGRWPRPAPPGLAGRAQGGGGTTAFHAAARQLVGSLTLRWLKQQVLAEQRFEGQQAQTEVRLGSTPSIGVPPTTCLPARSARSLGRHARPVPDPFGPDQQDRPRGTDARQSACCAAHPARPGLGSSGQSAPALQPAPSFAAPSTGFPRERNSMACAEQQVDGNASQAGLRQCKVSGLEAGRSGQQQFFGPGWL